MNIKKSLFNKGINIRKTETFLTDSIFVLSTEYQGFNFSTKAFDFDKYRENATRGDSMHHLTDHSINQVIPGLEKLVELNRNVLNVTSYNYKHQAIGINYNNLTILINIKYYHFIMECKKNENILIMIDETIAKSPVVLVKDDELIGAVAQMNIRD